MKKLNYILCLFNTAFFAFLILNGCTYFTSQQKDLREVGLAQSAPLRLNLIFPKIAPGDSVEVGALTDSVFLYGNVSDPTGELIVEGIHFPIHPGGGWLAYVPLDSVKDYSSEVFGDAGSASSVTIIYRSASYERELKSQIPIPGHTKLPDEQIIQRRLWFFQPTPKPIYPVVTEPFDARLEVTNTSAKIRCGMPGTYYLFPPLGTILKATGVRKTGHTFYQVPLGAGEIGWIEDVEVKVSPGQPGAKLAGRKMRGSLSRCACSSFWSQA